MKLFHWLDHSQSQNPYSHTEELVATTNFISLTTIILTFFYLFLYIYAFNSWLLAIINLVFAISYLMPIVLNQYHHYNLAKNWFFISLVIHIFILANFIFPLATGFHLYLILVIPGVHFVFHFKESRQKSALIFFAVTTIAISEFNNNPNPYIELSPSTIKLFFHSALFCIIFLLLITNHLFTKHVNQREAAYKLMANTDSLTELYNRRYFGKIIEKQIEFMRRYHSTFSLVSIDIDFFKTVNDRFGHAAGDTVLKQFATLLKENSRLNDYVARIGGEEFVIVLPETDKLAAFKMAETFRANIEKYTFNLGHNKSLQLTVSIGIQECEASNLSSDKLLEQADKALYCAKESGRNKSVIYQKLNR